MKPDNLIRRREFLTATAATLAASSSSVALAGTKTTVDVKSVKSASFQKFVGSTFVCGRNELLLESVKVVADPNAKRPKGIRSECFSLLFSAPAGVVLPAGNYSLTNAGVSPFTVYMSKVAVTRKVVTRPSSNPGLLKLAAKYVGDASAKAKSGPPRSYYEVAFS